MCLKLNRYSDFGNDAPAHIFYFFLISSLIKYFEKWDKNNINQFLIVGAYIVFNKMYEKNKIKFEKDKKKKNRFLKKFKSLFDSDE